MYQEDSFFSLSTAGSVGLACLSGLLAGLVFASAWHVTGGRKFPVRLGWVMALFVGFVWLSPQVYYFYYGFLFEGLPQQWVARWPSLIDLIQTVSFSGRANLSAHTKGALFWGLVILAIMRRGPRL